MTVTTEMQKLMDQLLAEVADIKLKQAHPPITIDPGKQTQGHSRVSPRVYTLQEKMEMRMGWIPNRPPSSFASVEYHRLHAYPVETHSRKNLLDVEVMYETRLG